MTLRHDYVERNRRSHSRRIRPYPGGSYGCSFREAGVSRTVFYLIREFAANTLHGAGNSVTHRRVTHHSVRGHVASEGLLVRRMGHRPVLLVVDPYSVAMAPSFCHDIASDVHSSHETLCGRVIGVRSFTSLWRVCCGFPKCGISWEPIANLGDYRVYRDSRAHGR
jgi:hypothetical protein